MDTFNIGVLIILGIGVFGGTVGATLFQRFHVPQVVGYVAIGLLIGETGFGLVRAGDIARLLPVNLFALGIIGFLVGGELKAEIFKGRGKQLFAVLFCEGVGAFVLVGAAVGTAVYLLLHDTATALAAGAVFGAIASATDPASTLNVLWEYRSRGILTTTLIAIVALDDALAMALYGFGTAAARVVTGGSASITGEILKTVGDLGGAVLLGIGAGAILNFVIRWMKKADKTFPSAVGTILLVIGIAAAYELDVILASMSLGVTLTNLAPRRSKEIFGTIRSFATPIYVIFFVLVGARLNIGAMPTWLWGIVALYVTGRSVGKIGGAFIGAAATGADPVVRRYVGLGLFAQGGIAVGLSIMAGHHLSDVPITDTMSLGDMIVFGITASTLVVQITGPPLIKLASKLAGEIGRDVTEEDVVETWTVADAMTKDVKPIAEETPLASVFEIFAHHDHVVYPVVDHHGDLKGVIALDDLKQVLASHDTWDWVLAADVMAPVVDKVAPDVPLRKALDYMDEVGVEEMPVVGNGSGKKPAGILDVRGVRIRLNEEVLRRRHAA